MTTWWLSFTDATRPKGSQSLGVILVDAETCEAAIAQTHLLSVNPGGEVAVMAITDEMKAADGDDPRNARVLALPRLTLLSRADVEAAGVETESIGEAVERTREIVETLLTPPAGHA